MGYHKGKDGTLYFSGGPEGDSHAKRYGLNPISAPSLKPSDISYTEIAPGLKKITQHNPIKESIANYKRLKEENDSNFFDNFKSAPHPYGDHIKIKAHHRGIDVHPDKASNFQVMSKLPSGDIFSTGTIDNDITHATLDKSGKFKKDFGAAKGHDWDEESPLKAIVDTHQRGLRKHFQL